jgi:hypothetical protein
MVEFTSAAGAPLLSLESREFNNSFGSRASRFEIAAETLLQLNVASSKLDRDSLVLPDV